MLKRCALVLFCCALWVSSNAAQQPGTPQQAVPREPIAAIAKAFDTYSVVALSEGTHGNEQSEAFLLSLFRDARFLDHVNDIMLEGLNSRYQDVMDRYVQGENVPVELLRPLWEDTTQVQAGPTMASGIVPAELRAVRTLNASLAPARRLRILLSDPPIDWTQIHSREDHAKWLALRDTYPAGVIEREVLAKGRHVLVVFGNMHFQRKQLLANYDSAGDGLVATVVSALEQAGRKQKVFSIWTATDTELSDIDPNVSAWPIPSLAIVRGTGLGAADFTRYYPAPPNRFSVQNGRLVPVPREQWRTVNMENQFDAVLYLGPKSTITVPPIRAARERCADPTFIREHVARAVMVGLPEPEIDRLRQLCPAQ